MIYSLFVFGAPRSGTTLVARHLRSLGGSFGLPAPRRLGGLVGGRSKKYHNGGPAWARALEANDTKTLLHLFLDAAERTRQPDVFVNKRIANILFMPAIYSTFPNAIAVHVVRHPYDVVMSILKQREKKLKDRHQRWGVFDPTTPPQDPDPVRDCAQQYRDLVARIEANLGGFQRHFVVPYEVYCQSPPTALNDICELTGLATGEAPEPLTAVTYERDPQAEEKIVEVLGAAFYRRQAALAAGAAGAVAG